MIRQGKTEDLETIMKMVNETIKIMQEEGIDQWDESYPTLDIFETDKQAKSLFVMEEEGQIKGSISIDKNLPEEYVPIPWSTEGLAYTFHRLVVNPFSRGNGVASQLIQFAEILAMKNGATALKIDTYSLNKKAQNLFIKNGFRKVGEMSFHGKANPFYCYEKLLR